MPKNILDASALLALIYEEPGWQIVAKSLSESAILSINYSEVLTRQMIDGIPKDTAISLLKNLIPEIIPFDEALAIETARLITQTKSLGLSLADRACLALSKTRRLPVMTADKIWLKLNLGIKIICIR